MNASLRARWCLWTALVIVPFALPSTAEAQQPKLDIKLFAGASGTTYVELLESGRERDTFAGWQIGFGARIRKRRWFVEALFSFNRSSIPRITQQEETEDGELLSLSSDTRTIEVHSVLANEPDPRLKPQTSPVAVEQDDYRLLIALGALGVLVLGALLGWLLMRWWQRRDRPEPAPPPPPPPWETALAELRVHEQQRPAAIAEGRTEAWVDAVSDSIRGYLGRRFGFHGLESTTDEIAERLATTKALGIAPEEAIAFLGQCDLVKFAKASIADEASRTLIEEAFSLVDRTRPKVAAAQGGAS